MQFKTRNVTSKQSVAVLSHLMDNSAEGGLTQLNLGTLYSDSLIYPQGVDLAYLHTGISRVSFWVLNWENLYFFGYWSQLLYFLSC